MEGGIKAKAGETIRKIRRQVRDRGVTVDIIIGELANSRNERGEQDLGKLVSLRTSTGHWQSLSKQSKKSHSSSSTFFGLPPLFHKLNK